jgi:hypothetical protein
MAGRAAGELDDLRTALTTALDRLALAAADLVVIVGSGPATRVHTQSSIGTFTGFGLPLSVRLDGDPAAPAGERLPLSLGVGAWLLAGRSVARRGQAIAVDAPVGECVAVGATLAGSAARVGLLIMGDGSACRGDKSPGYGDPRAEAFDASVTAALRGADGPALLAIDPDEAASLLAAGRAPWQVLAGAAGSDAFGGDVSYDAAPYGVQYTVATWERT